MSNLIKLKQVQGGQKLRTDVDELLQKVGQQSVADQIAALDVTDTAVEGSYVSAVSQEDGKVKVSRAALPDYSNTYDAKGAAAAVLGAEGDTADKATVYGAKAAAAANAAAIKDLQDAIGEDGSVASQIKAAIEDLDVTDAAVEKQFVTAVSEADGKISVARRGLEAADIPELAQSKITGLEDALAGKQANLVFMTAYNADSNPVATKSDIAALTGAMHFEGVKDAVPSDNTGYESGDVILVGNKEYVFDGSAWKEIGDETLYVLAGSIKDSDVAADAGIAQSKIAGLVDALAAKANTADLGTMAAEAAADYVKKTEAAGYDDILTKTAAESIYVKQETGKGLSTNDYTTAEKTKLAGIAEGAEVNVQANWTETDESSDAFILNKPTLGALAAKDKVAETDLATELGAKIHTHANKTQLDSITDAKIALWDSAEKTVVKHIPFASLTDVSATGFKVPMVADEGYSLVTGSLAKVIVNSAVYVVTAANPATVAVDFLVDSGDEIHVEFREVKA